MKFSLDEPAKACTVRSYGPGYIKFSLPALSYLEAEREEGKGFRTVCRSVIASSHRLEDWAPDSFPELEEVHFQALLALKPEVVIVGTGERPRFPSPFLVEPLLRQQVGVEFMGTPAACRTYNILVGKERRVIAALLMI